MAGRVLARRTNGQRGFTLLEVMAAIALITIGLLGLLTVIPAMMTVTRMSRESQIATSAIRSQLDDMRSTPFPDPGNTATPNIFNTYNNATFTAVGLSGALGKVTFLSEAQASSLFNVALDLDNDGVTSTATVVNTQYIAYPARVELFWTDSTNAARGVTLTTIIYNTNK